jgi:hypothetical protein
MALRMGGALDLERSGWRGTAAASGRRDWQGEESRGFDHDCEGVQRPASLSWPELLW